MQFGGILYVKLAKNRENHDEKKRIAIETYDGGDPRLPYPYLGVHQI